ncbi:MAG: hypothetical protein JRH11_14495 [Deltaproteobacteria bacterium]|nr:hypothetical protein [Deltaproteobacteria bacterium]
MDDTLASIVAGLICLGLWGVLAMIAGGLGHFRMKRVETALGRRAEASPERVQLFYAGAAGVWLGAAILAMVGLARRDWARTGRNCLFIFLGHIALVIALVPLVLPADGAVLPAMVVPILVLACSLLAVSSLFTAIFAARWALIRAKRLEGSSPTDALPLGAARYALYLASLAFWPAGLVGVFVFSKPENARVGATSFIFSLVSVTAITLGVCIALPMLADAFL